MSALWPPNNRDDADRRLRWLLSLQGVRADPKTEAWGLLRVLHLWHGGLPADFSRSALALKDNHAAVILVAGDCVKADWAGTRLTLAAVWSIPAASDAAGRCCWSSQ